MLSRAMGLAIRKPLFWSPNLTGKPADAPEPIETTKRHYLRGVTSETEELNIQHLRDIQHLGISGASKLLIIGAPGEIRTPGLLVRSYTRAPLLSSPGYAGVRSFNGLFLGFFFL